MHWNSSINLALLISRLNPRGHNSGKGAFKCFRTILIVNAKLTSGLLKPLVLIFLIRLLFFLFADFFHMASQS